MTEATLSSPADTDQAGTPEETPAVPEKPEASAIRLIITLGVAGLLAGLILVLGHKATKGAIERNKEAAIQAAITEVLNAPERNDILYIHEGKLVAEVPAGVDAKALERVFYGFDGSGRPIGFAVVHGEPGFQDIVRLIFGYDPVNGHVLGMKVLESKETPGLGDKIILDESFTSQFKGIASPLSGVKAGAGAGQPGEIDMITGATISSRAVIRIINNKLEEVRPLLEAYAEAGP